MEIPWERKLYTFSDVDKAHKIEATFAFANYTAENPFKFPETKGVTSTLKQNML